MGRRERKDGEESVEGWGGESEEGWGGERERKEWDIHTNR